ncbi:hypothetical protein GQR58_011333 [Nymphon striatum]|nr:hypothetical protein GQR58_011333 [Nymphon striatum]
MDCTYPTFNDVFEAVYDAQKCQAVGSKLVLFEAVSYCRQSRKQQQRQSGNMFPDSSLRCLSLWRSSRMREAVLSYVMRGICIQRRTLLRPESTTGGADAQQFLIHDGGADSHNECWYSGLQHLCRSNMWFMDGWNIFYSSEII